MIHCTSNVDWAISPLARRVYTITSPLKLKGVKKLSEIWREDHDDDDQVNKTS